MNTQRSLSFLTNYSTAFITMLTILYVALGGALGAAARYGISKITFLTGHDFPWMTFAANLIGALIIGFIAGAMMSNHRLSPNQLALLKTGFCGGLTTFSTFSLEAVTLFDAGHWGVAMIYLVASTVLCLGGVLAGRALALQLFST